MSREARPERVLVHVNNLELGGTQINAVDLAAAVRGHGFESVLVGPSDTLPQGPSLLDVAEERGLRIQLYDPASSMLRRAGQLSRLADANDADLLHVYGSWGGGARPTYWGFSRFGRRPWLQTVYEMQVDPQIKRHMPLIVGTGYLLDDLAARPGKTVLISPPVDLDTDRPDPIAAARFRADHGLSGPLMVIVSRLDASMKAFPISVAIDAMRDLAASATLVIVGAGDDEQRLKALGADVDRSVGRSAVRFIGALSNPRPAYAAADVMLGMGGSAARSLAFGKPLVVQGENGWSQLFDDHTADALARNSYWSADHVPDPRGMLVEAVRPVLADRGLRNRLGTFGRRFAADRFGLPAMADRLAAVYRESSSAYGLRRWAADLPPEIPLLSRKVVRMVTRHSDRTVLA